jgi:ABC-2 type transport system ATP-binding protein
MAVEVVVGVLRDYSAQGAPVLFSSHQLDIVERLCDDVVVIGGGRILAAGSREELRARHSGRAFEIELAGSAPDAGWVRDQPGVDVTSLDGGYARFDADTDEAAQAVLVRAVADPAMSVRRFAPVTPSLSQIFKEVVQ